MRAGTGVAAAADADGVVNPRGAVGVGPRLDMERAGARGDQLAVAGHWLAGGEVAPGTGGTAPVQRRVALEAGTEEVEAPVAGGGPVVIERIDADQLRRLRLPVQPVPARSEEHTSELQS